VKPALEALQEYLDTKRIKYDMSSKYAIWFSLLIPTPEIREMPNRYVSCGIRMADDNGRILYFTATVMAVEISEELQTAVRSFFMQFQSSGFKAGRIVVRPDGTIYYSLAQFLCAEGTIDSQAISSLLMTAIVEIAAIYMMRDSVVKTLPLATVQRFGIA
jgi:hypothetical protein